MNQPSQKNRSIGGFAVLEGLLVLVIIGAIIGVGAYVVKVRHDVSKTTAVTTTTSAASPTATTAAPGTTASIDQITQQELQSESASISSNDTAYQQAATSDSSAASNLGGAYNATTF